MEVRLFNASIESVVDVSNENQDNTKKVIGYVNETDTWSQVLGRSKKFREKIQKGAFLSALARVEEENRCVDLLLEHDDRNLLASTSNGSLVLSEDEKGLKFEATLVDTTLGLDTYKMIRSNLIANMSFGFYNAVDAWNKGEDGIYERTIRDLDLVEVSIVKSPAYLASNVQARSLTTDEDALVPEDEVVEDNKNENNEDKKEDKTEDIQNNNEESKDNSKENQETELKSEPEPETKPEESSEEKEEVSKENKEDNKEEEQTRSLLAQLQIRKKQIEILERL